MTLTLVPPLEAPLPKALVASRRRSYRRRRKIEGFGSISLPPETWMAKQEIANREQCELEELIGVVNKSKAGNSTLPDAIGIFTMLYFRAATTKEGHKAAGHGNFEWMCRRARVQVRSDEASS